MQHFETEKNQRIFSFTFLVFRNQSDKYIPPTS